MTIEFEITTPERTVYKETVDQITLPTTTGEITILPNHMPLVSELTPGELRVVKGNDTTVMAVASGYVEVRTGNKVIILTDAAERAEEIDVERAEVAKVKAEKAMAGIKENDVKFADATTALQRSLVRLNIAKRQRHRGHHNVGSEGVLKDT